ncbi:MAG: DUF456 domain-containing protein [Thermodesulfobacteriota bacterium]
MIGQSILWIVVIALFLIGLAGTILPTLPGNLLIFGGALVYGIFTGFGEVTFWVLAALGAISIGAQVLDYAAEAYGAKRFGATKYGIWGAIIGGIVGFITFNIGGLIVGIFLGAVILEIIVVGRGLWWNPHEVHPGTGFHRDILYGSCFMFKGVRTHQPSHQSEHLQGISGAGDELLQAKFLGKSPEG